MSDQFTTTQEADASSGVILFGLMKGGAKHAGRAHAAYFAPADAILAEKAAGLMGLHVLPVRDESEYRDLMGQVAVGRIFANSGRGFVPFVKAGVFNRLCELGGIDPTVALVRPDQAAEPGREEPPRALTPLRRPKDWDDLGPGCLCLATEGAGQGFYPAVVTDVVAEGFVVAWRDFDPAEWPPFIQRQDQLGLLQPEAGQSDEPPTV